MSNDIRSRISGVGAVSRVGAGGGRSQTHEALASLASRVAEEVAHNLGLSGGVEGEGPGGRNFVLPSDLYEVRRQSDELARQLGAEPAQSARLTRALDRFAEACATLIAAQPSAFSVERVRLVVEQRGSGILGENAESACSAIESASEAVENGQW